MERHLSTESKVGDEHQCVKSKVREHQIRYKPPACCTTIYFGSDVIRCDAAVRVRRDVHQDKTIIFVKSDNCFHARYRTVGGGGGQGGSDGWLFQARCTSIP